MSENLKIDFDLLIKAVARELGDEPVKAFYNGERSTKDVDLAVDKIMLGSFVSIYQEKLPEYESLLQKSL